jgi:hypothetical protein
VFRKKEDPFEYNETYEIDTEKASHPLDERRPDHNADSDDEFFKPGANPAGLMAGFDFSEVFGFDMTETRGLYG